MMKNILIIILLLLVNIQADFVRDNTLNVVKDTTTCLMWQDDSNSKTVKKIWEEAIDYCEHLDFAGFDDWRLPNINELYSIGDKSKDSPAIQDVFLNISSGVLGNYWSSTTSYMNSISYARVVMFGFSGSNVKAIKDNNYSVRCVRTEQ